MNIYKSITTYSTIGLLLIILALSTGCANTTKPRVEYLADVTQHISEISKWVQYENHPFGTINNSIEAEKLLFKRLNKNNIPLVFIAIYDGKPIGSIGIKSNIALAGYEDRDIWFGGLFVLPEYRNQGVGSLLLTTACDKAVALGYNKISLFTSTEKAAEWYSHKNWHQFARDVYQGKEALLWELDLAH